MAHIANNLKTHFEQRYVTEYNYQPTWERRVDRCADSLVIAHEK